MTIKPWILAVVVLTAAAFGRFSAPEKVHEVIKTVEVEKKNTTKDTDLARDRKKTTVIKEVIKPDGTKETTTTTTDESKTTKETSSTDSTERSDTKESDKTITNSSGRITLSILGAIPTSPTQKPTLGVSATKAILGPIAIGIFGLTSGTVGGSIGLTF